jgi:hypothetical protein
MSNVLLGNIDVQASPVYTTNGNMPYEVTTGPVDSFTSNPTPSVNYIPTEGGILTDIPMERLDQPGVTLPTEEETSENGKAPMNKKNLLLFGIGGLVLAYLLFRKK